ncbi:MAG: PAS domain-containing protein [Desulfobacterales bacterium]|nr:PAS domain-containing protein [Desulfobacterales bacterium]
MKKQLDTKKEDLKRRRRETVIIGIVLPTIILLTYLGTKILDLGIELPIADSILIFALININVILLLLLLYLTMRNLVKLIFERKKKLMGSSLRAKLVFAFVILSLLPTIIIFFVSVQFISLSIEYWFNLQVEQSLQKSLEVGQDYYKRIGDEALAFGNSLSSVITHEGYMLLSEKDKLQAFIEEKRREYNLAAVQIISSKLLPRAASYDNRVDLKPFEDLSIEVLRKSFKDSTDMRVIQTSSHGDLVRGIVPIFSRTETKAQVGAIVVAKLIPGVVLNRLVTINKGLEGYKQLKMLKRPIKLSHLITLSIVTLLVIFSAIWFGFYLSKGITVPIEELAKATKKIASGNYSFHINLESKDEMGVLVDSFNRMTKDLREGKSKLDVVNRDLITSNKELDQRHLYMETILENVAAGVISADSQGVITTINKSAEKMLDISAQEIIGQNYKNVLGRKYRSIISGFVADRNLFKKGSIQREIGISIRGRSLKLLASLKALMDEQDNYLGLVAVFEDLTELERAQRMAAWREVARRIAHEVKNPLTPIQLSAQRLRRKYGESLAKEDGTVFDECTRLIIDNVEELKVLVNEFSNFARMPASTPVPDDIKQIIQDAILLYRDAHKKITFEFIENDDIPIVRLDKEQVKRAMINLFDNAVAAISGKGKISTKLFYDKALKILRIEVADTGTGISNEDKEHLFEPYFSTKKSGTGLGLAIVSRIISEHNGFIRVEDNEPKGTKFIIELPVRV